MIWKRLFTLYGFALFTFVFLLLLPAYVLLMYVERLARYSYQLDHIWAQLVFRLSFVKLEIVHKKELNPKQAYVFVANHFSYLDIACMGFLQVPYAFVGKASITKVPLFGWMFKKLHIPVNRSNLKSKYQAVAMAKRMIDKGRSVVFFPEGGIVTKHPPQMMPFKEGAFRTAIEKQIPIVPVSLPYNWIILPDDGKFLLRAHRLRVVTHEPIPTAGLTMEDLNELRKRAFALIEHEIEKNNYANHQRHHS